MIDHTGIPVSDYERSKQFYQQLFAPIGASLLMEVTPEQTGDGTWAAGFGRDRPSFWIGNDDRGVAAHTHIAFAADSRAQVEAFHAAGLAAGGRDNGAPGLRPHYHPNYYGAFVIDPDGHNVEAVCHSPE
jgi:catechol 2,3-dioxygenase-like lactoylglutathione lyase family enzyme